MSLSPELTSTAASLFCDEEVTWDEDTVATMVSQSSSSSSPPPYGRPMTALLAAELEFSPLLEYLPRYIDAVARQNAVTWILKASNVCEDHYHLRVFKNGSYVLKQVHEFHRFRPVTACLAVNYLDRFLCSHSLPENENGWPIQLISVACISVAAKFEETHVPLLLDLQVLEPRFIFDPRDVRRMELILMAALRWRMRAVTPFDFLEAIAGGCSRALVPRAAELVLSTLRVADFLRYPPSAIAAAAFLCAAEDLAADQNLVDLAEFPESLRDVTVSNCRRLMEDYVIDTCPSARQGCLCVEPLPPPPSPAGVLDAASACVSCDTITTSADPPPKRRRSGEVLIQRI